MNSKAITPGKSLKAGKSVLPEALEVVTTLQKAGFEAYLVGGCVRDLILGREPKDWDVTTDAVPEQIISLFAKTFYENSFGTVGVVIGAAEAAEAGLEKASAGTIIEVTPYRLEGSYSDGRHPDEVSFSKHVEDDLNRRDFTINAIAYDPIKDNIKDIVVDPLKGQEDIAAKVIKAVGEPAKRFQEDGLRIIRAVRFAAELGFTINKETEIALHDSREMLEKIAKERIRDEFSKIIQSSSPMVSLYMCQKLGILKYIIPELEEGLHTKQNQAHSYNVFEHLLRSLQCGADKDYPFEVRLAALLHDIGKPKSRRFSKEKEDYTFYGHEVIGADMAKKILERLHYPKKTIELVCKFVRWHMFFSDTEQISLSAVRRMIANVGKENIWNLMNLRVCDRIGTGRPKENPYRLRKYTAMIEEVLMDPISVGMLKTDGKRLMEVLHMEPGPKIGLILNALLEEVIEDPKLNTEMFLEKRAAELYALDIKDLKDRAEEGKKARENKEKEEVEKIREKYHVK